MKKLFIVLAVASLGFVACNNESKTETTQDTATVAPDTATTAPAAPDTTTAPAAADTAAKADTIKK